MTDQHATETELKDEIQRLKLQVETLEAINRENEYIKEDLRSTLGNLRAILDNIPDMAWLKDREGRFIAVNEAFQKACGIREEQLRGKTDADFWPKDLAERFRRHDLEVMKSGLRKIIEEPMASSAEGVVWIETIKSPIYNHRRKIVGTTGIARNISRRKQALVSLAESEAKYRELVQNARSIILRFDTSGRITFFNEYAQHFFGFTEQEVIGRNLCDAILPKSDSAGTDLVAMIDDLCANPDRFAANENQNMCRDGTPVWISWTNRGLYDDQGTLTEILSVGNDITALKRAEEKLRELATTDPLTGLFNRRQFLEVGEHETERAIRYGIPLAVMMVDLDYFKSINDRYGHDVGDKVLEAHAHVMRNALRKVDIVGRMGGEEFAVVLPYTSLEEARVSAERLRALMQEARVVTDSGTLQFTISVGVAEITDHCRDLHSLLKAADGALYSAKTKGRNRVEVSRDVNR